MTRTVPIAGMAALSLTACATAPSDPALEQFGGMREVMRQKRTEARVQLRERDARDMIAVGALEGLAGEITSDGERWWIATASANEVRIEHEVGARAATLLTLARVARWDEVVADAPLDEAALATLVAGHLTAHGIDPKTPWPLRVIGVADELALHVIRGDCPHAGDEQTPAFRWEAPRGAAVTLIGFCAPDAAGLMTHHGTAFHLHAIASRDGTAISGHVDRFRVAQGARVQVAAVPERGAR